MPEVVCFFLKKQYVYCINFLSCLGSMVNMTKAIRNPNTLQKLKRHHRDLFEESVQGFSNLFEYKTRGTFVAREAAFKLISTINITLFNHMYKCFWVIANALHISRNALMNSHKGIRKQLEKEVVDAQNIVIFKMQHLSLLE